MIGTLKAFAKRRWPRLRLRAILFAVLFFAAAMPGISAIFLRVYENTLVRQTEAELVAQGAALAAVAATDWPGAPNTVDASTFTVTVEPPWRSMVQVSPETEAMVPRTRT